MSPVLLVRVRVETVAVNFVLKEISSLIEVGKLFVSPLPVAYEAFFIRLGLLLNHMSLFLGHRLLVGRILLLS